MDKFSPISNNHISYVYLNQQTCLKTYVDLHSLCLPLFSFFSAAPTKIVYTVSEFKCMVFLRYVQY